jgi:hypothetical protein
MNLITFRTQWKLSRYELGNVKLWSAKGEHGRSPIEVWEGVITAFSGKYQRSVSRKARLRVTSLVFSPTFCPSA